MFRHPLVRPHLARRVRDATSPPTPAPAACTPRRATATRTSRSGRSTACRCSRRSTPQGRFTDEAGPYAGREGVRDQRRASSTTCAPTAALVHGETLAHSYPHCWRCKNPLIFRATEQWFLRIDHAGLRATRAGRDRPRRLGAAVGTRSHRQHDADAARLVPVAPARLGRADPRLSLRRLRPLPRRPGGDRARRGDLPRARLRRLVRAAASRAAARRATAARAAATAFTPDDNILDVWFDAGCSHDAVLQRARARLAGRSLRRSRRPAPRLVPGVADHLGRDRPARRRTARCSRTASSSTSAPRRCRSRSATSSSPDDVIAQARRRHPAAALRLGRLHRRHLLLAEPDHAAARELSQDPQHLPLPARQPGRLRSRRATRVPVGRAAGARPLDPAPRPAAAGALARRVRRVRVPSRRAGRGELLRRRSERALPRHRQGPSLHVRRPTRRGGARRRPTLQQLLDLLVRAHGADPLLHGRRDLVVRAGPRAPRRCSKPGCRRSTPRWSTRRWPRSGIACSTRAPSVTKALEEARKQGVIGHSLDARVQLRAERRPARRCSRRSATTLPALFIVSQVELADALAGARQRRALGRSRRRRRAGARRQVRALLELQRSGRPRRRRIRRSASAALPVRAARSQARRARRRSRQPTVASRMSKSVFVGAGGRRRRSSSTSSPSGTSATTLPLLRQRSR